LPMALRRDAQVFRGFCACAGGRGGAMSPENYSLRRHSLRTWRLERFTSHAESRGKPQLSVAKLWRSSQRLWGSKGCYHRIVDRPPPPHLPLKSSPHSRYRQRHGAKSLLVRRRGSPINRSNPHVARATDLVDRAGAPIPKDTRP